MNLHGKIWRALEKIGAKSGGIVGEHRKCYDGFRSNKFCYAG